MKKNILLLSVLLFSLLVACNSEDKDDVSLGNFVSAKYDATTQSFIVTYSSGNEKTYPAVIDNSVTPPTASTLLEDGTSLWFDNANISGNATSISKSNLKYVNSWIYDEMSIYYLWNDKLPRQPNYSLNPSQFFNSILNTYHPTTNPEGDRFSWIQESSEELVNELNGITSDEIGFEYIFVRANDAGTQYYALVLYPRHGTDAEAKGIDRGRFITQVDGKDITPNNYLQIFSGSGTKDLSLADWVYNENAKSYSLQKSSNVTIKLHKNYEENPVYLDSVYTMGTSKIGYLVYNFFARDNGDNSNDYDKILIEKLNQLKSTGVNEMVLDLRYNSGGAVSSAIALASALVKDRSTTKVFGTSEYNSIVDNALIKENGVNYNKDYFIDKIDGTSVSIPALNLPRLYVLTSGWTASASELIINGLKPYMEVILIGETTYGKNVGSISIYEENDPKNKWGMQPIIVKFFNSEGKSDYTAGFKPNYEIDEFNNLVLFDFGDTKDPLLGKALSLITGQNIETTAKSISTPFRSSQVDTKMTQKLHHNNKRFEMYDDIRGDEIRNLMIKRN